MSPLNQINIIKQLELSKLFTEFFNSGKASGLLLVFCAMVSLVVANTGWGEAYISFWHTKLAGISIGHWVNDGLMAVFFLLVGLEIERELYIGELSNVKDAILPLAAAAGGMLLPGLIYFFITRDTAAATGFGIPMATDIAFALGILSLAGKAVPSALKVFLVALAIIDDLGAISLIALFYTNELSLLHLFVSLGIFGGLFILGRMGVRNLFVYVIPGMAMWYFMYRSGVHASISGILLAFAIPFGKGDDHSLSYQLQHRLHIPVSFIIVPLFALANTGFRIHPGYFSSVFSGASLGILAGLLIGKPLGVIGFSWFMVKSKISSLPSGVTWRHITGAGILAGIGFTMSVFITLLAFTGDTLRSGAKLSILIASLLAALTGLLVLKGLPFTGKKPAGG